MLIPWGAVGAAEKEKDKAAWWIPTGAWDSRCMGSVGDGVGCNEYIGAEARQDLSPKSGERSALYRIHFRRPLQPGCIYTGEQSLPEQSLPERRRGYGRTCHHEVTAPLICDVPGR
jgi:hypothetical protein